MEELEVRVKNSQTQPKTGYHLGGDIRFFEGECLLVAPLEDLALPTRSGSCPESAMRRSLPIVVIILLFALIAMVIWVSNRLDFPVEPSPAQPSGKSEIKSSPPPGPSATEALLAGYGDPATPPLDDLRKIQRVAIGYFSVIKDSVRFPIGGNEDFATALRGENPNREVFIRPSHPVFSEDGLLIDRWGSPLIVHPEAWRQLELRSAGPDRHPFNDDDLILSPAGTSSSGK